MASSNSGRASLRRASRKGEYEPGYLRLPYPPATKETPSISLRYPFGHRSPLRPRRTPSTLWPPLRPPAAQSAAARAASAQQAALAQALKAPAKPGRIARWVWPPYPVAPQLSLLSLVWKTKSSSVGVPKKRVVTLPPFFGDNKRWHSEDTTGGVGCLRVFGSFM